MPSCEIYKIFKNSYIEEYLKTTAFENNEQMRQKLSPFRPKIKQEKEKE